ncbi:MAG: hypothetical protein R3338_12885, partial [Thermoanaerobaculia bacterium]|nr:hypothetical protein [Thermoanaerobaculia bacterium]
MKKISLILCFVAASCATTVGGNVSMDQIAREYVHLVLALGEHDPGYVDAYYGPADWKDDAKY